MSDSPRYLLLPKYAKCGQFVCKIESDTAGEGMKMFTISGDVIPVLGKKNVLEDIGDFHSREEFILL